MHGICNNILKYANNMQNICKIYAVNICKIYAQNMHKICNNMQ